MRMGERKDMIGRLICAVRVTSVQVEILCAKRHFSDQNDFSFRRSFMISFPFGRDPHPVPAMAPRP